MAWLAMRVHVGRQRKGRVDIIDVEGEEEAPPAPPSQKRKAQPPPPRGHRCPPRESGNASCRSMPYTWSHTTPYVMLPTRYRASVSERCNDRMRHTAIINLSSMVGSGGTASITLVSGVSTICPVSGRYLTV